MEEDKHKVVNLFSHHATLENAQPKDSLPSPASTIQFNAPVTNCQFTQVFHKAPNDPEKPCSEIRLLEDKISQLELLLKNK